MYDGSIVYTRIMHLYLKYSYINSHYYPSQSLMLLSPFSDISEVLASSSRYRSECRDWWCDLAELLSVSTMINQH